MWSTLEAQDVRPIDDVTETLYQLHEMPVGDTVSYEVGTTRRMKLRVVQRNITAIVARLLTDVFHNEDGVCQLNQYSKADDAPLLHLSLYDDQEWRLSKEAPAPYNTRLQKVLSAMEGKLVWNRKRVLSETHPMRVAYMHRTVTQDLVQPHRENAALQRILDEQEARETGAVDKKTEVRAKTVAVSQLLKKSEEALRQVTATTQHMKEMQAWREKQQRDKLTNAIAGVASRVMGVGVGME